MSIVVKLGLTALIIVMMLPGLVVEPGPISEIVGVGAILTLWGFGDVLGGSS